MNVSMKNVSFGFVDCPGEPCTGYKRPMPTINSVLELGKEAVENYETGRFKNEEIPKSIINVKNGLKKLEEIKINIIKDLKDYNSYIKEKHKGDKYFLFNNYVERYLEEDIPRLNIEI